jgi:Kef-type K+ transport system membrane component KefB
MVHYQSIKIIIMKPLKEAPLFVIFLFLTFILALMVFVGLFAWMFGADWGLRMFIGSLLGGPVSTIFTIICAKLEI